MSRLWNPSIHKLHPYIPGEQPHLLNLTKLNTNESPYGPSPKAIEAIKNAANEDLRLYPDPTARKLCEVIADKFDLKLDNVFVGNGSDEVLAHAFRAFFRPENDILFADVTYGFYPVYCELFGLSYRHIPLKEDFCLAVEDYQGPCGGIAIANPNANTGIALPLDAIEQLLKSQPDCVVIIDEAYVDFGAETAVSLIKNYDNLLVVRTFSKSSGLAGLRVGYALGAPELIEALTRVKDSFNSYPLPRTSQAGAVASLLDEEWFGKTVRHIVATREKLIPQLEALGFKILPSQANFILIHHPEFSAVTLHNRLRDQSIIVRHLSSVPRIQEWLRVTIGSDQDCENLIRILRKILENPSLKPV
ncbi:histidinol-phosphate transaminase [Aristophania vespae]|uniref:Histidinol-phosphate aminotransferase n=1 Tax=Aristophania vespae TaxID=2697033 RepID=A0A6P1N9L0_9PROT|nr:histidinol-phosphate transaminase [Aristophania vespae]QHI95255.1 histidinol-phosphate transaminase [Aristophania vespae]